MRHYRTLEEADLQNSWLTVGVFDGVHRGHQQILKRLTAGAHERGVPAVVLTFDPHPAKLFGRSEMKQMRRAWRRLEQNWDTPSKWYPL
jgi:riboflavin kinase/FMN adenylyltransferase